jgi:hypothetical protein
MQYNNSVTTFMHSSLVFGISPLQADCCIKSDGVHLTPVGNDIFLNILQGAIEYLMSSNLGGLTFPTHNESI